MSTTYVFLLINLLTYVVTPHPTKRNHLEIFHSLAYLAKDLLKNSQMPNDIV